MKVCFCVCNKVARKRDVYEEAKLMSAACCFLHFQNKPCRQMRYMLWPATRTAASPLLCRILAFSYVCSCFDWHSNAVERCTVRPFILLFVLFTYSFHHVNLIKQIGKSSWLMHEKIVCVTTCQQRLLFMISTDTVCLHSLKPFCINWELLPLCVLQSSFSAIIKDYNEHFFHVYAQL